MTRDPDDADDVALTHLDQPLFDGAGVTKGELVDYLDAVADRLLPALRDRPLSVVRARPGQPPFVQKNLPGYAPPWIPRVEVPTGSARGVLVQPLCHDRRTLRWLANQRCVEFHPMLVRGREGRVTDLVIDLDPPQGTPFARVAEAAVLVRAALAGAGLAGAVKTSGSKGVHVLVPVAPGLAVADAAAATRALAARTARLDPRLVTTAYLLEDREGRIFVDPTRAGGGSLAAVYGPRARPGLPVSFPVGWDLLDRVDPADLTVRTAPGLLAGRDPWQEQRPADQAVPPDLIEEGYAIPVPRVVALHAGRRRAAARRASPGPP